MYNVMLVSDPKIFKILDVFYISPCKIQKKNLTFQNVMYVLDIPIENFSPATGGIATQYGFPSSVGEVLTIHHEKKIRLPLFFLSFFIEP